VFVPDTWVTVYTEDMGNTFAPKGFARGSSLRASSSIIVHEADEPNPLVGLFDADGLTGEHLAEELGVHLKIA
jgi:hypothetical protein